MVRSNREIEIKGTIDGTSNDLGPIGKVKSKTSVRDIEPEMIRLEFYDKLHFRIKEVTASTSRVLSRTLPHGENLIGFTTTVRTAAEHPVFVRDQLGEIDAVTPTQGITRGEIRISIFGAGNSSTTYSESTIVLPSDLNLRNKVLYIPRVGLYVSGDLDSLKALNPPEQTVIEARQAHPVANVTVTGKVKHDTRIHYIFNNIEGNVLVQPGDVPRAVVQISFPGIGEVFETTFDNSLLLSGMDQPAYGISDMFGGCKIMLDFDKVRLRTHWDQTQDTAGWVSQEEDTIINKLRSEVNQLKEEQATTLRTNDAKLNAKEATITDLRGKLAEASSDSKIKQEDLKTKREEVKYVSAKSDSSASIVSDSLKVGGSILGFGVLTFTVLNKWAMSGATVAKMVEWGIPAFMGTTTTLSTTTSAVGGFVTNLVGGIVAALAGANPLVTIGAIIVGGIAGLMVGSTYYDYIKSALKSTKEFIIDTAEAVWETACDVVSSVTETVTEFVSDTWDTITGKVASLCWW